MAVLIEKLGPGTLTLGSPGTGYEMQVSRCVLVPDNQEDDLIPTLGDPFPAPTYTTNWTLEGDVVSDWSEVDGFVNYCFDNGNALVDFEFVPRTDLTVKWTG